MTKEQKIKRIEEILDLEEGTLTEETVVRDLEDWDSVAVISFIALLDDEFNKIVKGTVIREQKTVADLMTLMEK